MISSAFKGAVQSEISAQGQEMNNMYKPAKEFASTALSMFGLKGAAALAGSSVGQAATQAVTQEKMLAAVKSQEALDAAYERAMAKIDYKHEEGMALHTVYEQLTKARQNQEVKETLMEELKRGDEE